MAARVQGGPRRWSVVKEDDGHRTYTIVHLVVADRTDGPAAVLAADGLPQFGDIWNFFNDIDDNAWCTNASTATPLVNNEINVHYEVEQKFSSKGILQCPQDTGEHPLDMRPKVSASYIRSTEEATQDRFGFPIRNSAHETIYGPQVSFDKCHLQLRIEANFEHCPADPRDGWLNEAMNKVNSAKWLGFPYRTVKLSEGNYTKEYYGTCIPYYKTNLTFDILEETFDRYVVDMGTKVLNGHWLPTGIWQVDKLPDGTIPDSSNPAHFKKYIDRNNAHTTVILNNFGLPEGACVQFEYPTLAKPPVSKVVQCTLASPQVGDNYYLQFIDTDGVVTELLLTTLILGDFRTDSQMIDTMAATINNTLGVHLTATNESPEEAPDQHVLLLTGNIEGEAWNANVYVINNETSGASSNFTSDIIRYQQNTTYGTGYGCTPVQKGQPILVSVYKEFDFNEIFLRKPIEL